MTETTAKSGAAGAPTTPVEEETAADNGSGTPATGRAAVGRAAVPAEAASPKFTRAPGMNPPPEQPAEGASGAPGATTPGSPGSGAAGPAGPSGSGVSPSSVSSGLGSPVVVVAPPATGKAQVSAPPAGPASAAGRPSGPGATGTVPAGMGRAATGTSSVRTVGAPGGPGAAGAATAGAAGGSAMGAARVNEAVRSARTSVTSGSGRGPRRARLNLKRIDPWSVMKFSFAVSLVLFIVVIVATSVLYLALDAMDVFQTVNTSLGDLISAGGGTEASTFKITAKGVIGTSALIGLVNVVLFTALATLGAFIYNVCADLVGGVELTLAERD